MAGIVATTLRRRTFRHKLSIDTRSQEQQQLQQGQQPSPPSSANRTNSFRRRTPSLTSGWPDTRPPMLDGQGFEKRSVEWPKGSRLTYKDFWPESIAWSSFDPSLVEFESFDSLIPKANTWLEENPGSDVIKCETVERKCWSLEHVTSGCAMFEGRDQWKSKSTSNSHNNYNNNINNGSSNNSNSRDNISASKNNYNNKSLRQAASKSSCRSRAPHRQLQQQQERAVPSFAFYIKGLRLWLILPEGATDDGAADKNHNHRHQNRHPNHTHHHHHRHHHHHHHNDRQHDGDNDDNNNVNDTARTYNNLNYVNGDNDYGDSAAIPPAVPSSQFLSLHPLSSAPNCPPPQSCPSRRRPAGDDELIFNFDASAVSFFEQSDKTQQQQQQQRLLNSAKQPQLQSHCKPNQRLQLPLQQIHQRTQQPSWQQNSILKNRESRNSSSNKAASKNQPVVKFSSHLRVENELEELKQDVNQITDVLPQDSQAVPQDSQAVPLDSQVVPQDSQAVPQEFQPVPQDFPPVPPDVRSTSEDCKRPQMCSNQDQQQLDKLKPQQCQQAELKSQQLTTSQQSCDDNANALTATTLDTAVASHSCLQPQQQQLNNNNKHDQQTLEEATRSTNQRPQLLQQVFQQRLKQLPTAQIDSQQPAQRFLQQLRTPAVSSSADESEEERCHSLLHRNHPSLEKLLPDDAECQPPRMPSRSETVNDKSGNETRADVVVVVNCQSTCDSRSTFPATSEMAARQLNETDVQYRSKKNSHHFLRLPTTSCKLNDYREIGSEESLLPDCSSSSPEKCLHESQSQEDLPLLTNNQFHCQNITGNEWDNVSDENSKSCILSSQETSQPSPVFHDFPVPLSSEHPAVSDRFCLPLPFPSEISQIPSNSNNETLQSQPFQFYLQKQPPSVIKRPFSIGYINIIPRCVSQREKYPVYETLPETYSAINTYLTSSPIEGRIITIETMVMKLPVRTWTGSLVDPDKTFFLDEYSHHSLSITRIYYAHGRKTPELIGAQDFLPDVLTGNSCYGSSFVPKYGPMETAMERARLWIRSVRNVRIANIQTLEAALRREPDGLYTGLNFLEKAESYLKVRFLRISYVSPRRDPDLDLGCSSASNAAEYSRLYEFPPTVGYKTFVPAACKVAMFSGLPSYEVIQSTWLRSKAWLRLVDCGVVSAETVYHPIRDLWDKQDGGETTVTCGDWSGSSRRSGGPFMRRISMAQIVRIYMDGVYPDPPFDLLPPPPMVREVNDCGQCCII